MYVLRGIPVVTMGYSTDPLDVCFGDQLAGSVTLGTYAQGLAHVFVVILLQNFGALFEVLCVGWVDESEIV